MATSEGPRRWPKTKDFIAEALKKISEVADQEAEEGEAELEQLRLRSAKVDGLQQENDRLRKELEVALKSLDERKSKERVIPASDIDSSEEYSPESQRIKYPSKNGPDAEPIPRRSAHELFKNARTQDVAIQTLERESVEEEYPNKVPPAWSDEVLEKKYNDLVPKYKKYQEELIVLQKNHTSVLDARQKLEDKVRTLKSRYDEFIRYGDHLNRNNKKLQAELTNCPHGHNEILSSSVEKPSHKVRKSGNLAGQPDRDDEVISTSPLRLSQSDLELRPSPSASSPTKPSDESNQPWLRAPRNWDQTDSPAVPNNQILSEDPHVDELPTNESIPPPLGVDEVDQELPRLRDRSGNSQTQPSNHTSSTQGEPYTMPQDVPNVDSPAVKSEGESPVVVRVRRIHKSKSRRTNTSNAAVNRDVKVEEILSSPIGLAAIDYGGSMDLDDHPHMVTPRKRKTPVISHGGSPSRPSILNDQDEDNRSKSVQAPRSSAILVERSPDKTTMNSNALQPKSSNKQLFRQIDDGQPPQKRQRRLASPTVTTSLAEDGENVRKSNRGPRNKNSLMLSDLTRKPPSRSSVISPGITPLTVTSASRSNFTPGTSPSRSSSKAGSLARGGPSASLSAKRLSRVETRVKIASSGDVYDFPTSSPRAEQPETTSKASKSSKKKSTERHADGPVEDDPDNEPLRCRPVESLTLNDFKVNPIFNQGFKYAFHEVVRKKEERRCLPGCERPCCAPKFRVLAEMTIAARVTPVPASIQESDKRAIMNYLGDDFPRFSKMSAEKKKEILVLAIARQIATDNGKHRHAYSRMATPPGFWNVEFPTTQEEAANREAAWQAERQQVEERYREAMRPGGTYIFRDE